MNWRRFLLFSLLGWVLSITFVACTPQPQNPPPTLQGQNAAGSQNQSTREELPAATASILQSLGGKDIDNPPRGQVRLMVISDLNSAYGSTDYEPEVAKALALIPFWQPDMVVCSGDMVAGQDISLSPAQIKAMWAGFDRHIAAPLRQSKMPYGFTIGNHDASSALGVANKYLFQKERDLASAYWQDPQHDPGLQFIDRYQFPFYYTFEYKDIFFLAWDGSSDHIPPDKLAWVEKALASPKAQNAKMRILLGHLPLYAVAIGRNEPGEVMRNADRLRQMLEKYKVHTYISGHHHAYYPAHKGKLQLLHTGILGSGPRPLIDGNLPPQKTVTLIDINFDSPTLTTYTTYNMDNLKLIEYQQLPRFLAGHNGMVLRRDLEMKDLTPAEKSSCVQKIGSKLCTS